MAVPKQKTSRARRNNRRSHHRIEKKELSTCKNCGYFYISHHACTSCGFYKNKKVI